MPKITIDGQAVQVAEGTTILQAARQIGITIPTICYVDNDCEPSASCLVCVVKLLRTGQMIPSCATRVTEGMEIESQTAEVAAVRRAAVELVMSDHVGDCLSLCSQSCPAHMDIAAMLRQVRGGNMAEAIAIIKQQVALPATMGRICHRPCQRSCRRKTYDSPIAIGQVEKFVADADLAAPSAHLPKKLLSTGRRVAIVGAGPAGLAAAWHLLLRGHDCTLFDERPTAGGTLCEEFPSDVLPPAVLAAEVEVVRQLGATFDLGGPRVDAACLDEMVKEFDAVLCAVGRVDSAEVAQLGLAAGRQGIGIDEVMQTSQVRVFAAGQCAERTGKRVHSIASGRKAAVSIDQFLKGEQPVRQMRPFSSQIKCLRKDEMPQFLAGGESSTVVREHLPPPHASLSQVEAEAEATRCCRCDCRKQDDCRLREAAEHVRASRSRYAAPRREMEFRADHEVVVFEPGKCIRCGNCLRVTEQAGEPLGLTFVGRGFNVKVTAPLSDAIAAAIQRTGQACVDACPTAALSMKTDGEIPGEFLRHESEVPSTNGEADETPSREVGWIEPVIPCQTACPAHTRIPEYLAAVARGAFNTAYRINLEDNVFPAILGRVCARPCESACRHGRGEDAEALAICFSKRAAADFAASDPITLPPLFAEPTGKRVAVVGAGVAGMTAARELARCGHSVTVLEKHIRPGGMMNQGIPAFRLPRDIIEREVEQVRRSGVEIRCGVDVGKDVTIDSLLAENDAVIMAAGTLRRNYLDLPGKDLAGVRHGLDFLLDVNEQRLASLSGPVIVIGGGFTAMDCARAARRLTESSVTVCYRRSRQEMLVTPGELDELQHEGIPLEEMLAPIGYEGDAEGHVRGVRFVRTALGEPDASGRRRPVPIAGSENVWPADNVILATGQFPETSWIDAALSEGVVDRDGWLKSGKAVRTSHAKLFAAGDFAQGAMSLIDAIGHAKRCAREVDTFLVGRERWGELALVESAGNIGREAENDRAGRQPMPAQPVSERKLTTEVETGFSRHAACAEAGRCYLCCYLLELDARQCIHCGACLEVKSTDTCIMPIWGPKRRGTNGAAPSVAEFLVERAHLAINQDTCVRCNACADVCPVECISVRRVERMPAGLIQLT